MEVCAVPNRNGQAANAPSLKDGFWQAGREKRYSYARTVESDRDRASTRSAITQSLTPLAAGKIDGEIQRAAGPEPFAAASALGVERGGERPNFGGWHRSLKERGQFTRQPIECACGQSRLLEDLMP